MEKNKSTTANDTPDTDYYIRMMSVSEPLRKATLGSAIETLQLPSESRGLDAGCGIGLQALLLAEAVGPEGHVTGLDISHELLLHAQEIVNQSNLAQRISFRQGDINQLPFDDESFDWVWSTDCAGYSPKEPLPLLKEFARVVKSGGIVALLYWSSQQLLPGYPLLEARLNATSAGIAPFIHGEQPERHFLRKLGWLRQAGLVDARARTFVGDVQAPFNDEIREALLALFQMRWGDAESEVTQGDWAEFQRLCQPESPDFILDRPDYYAFFTYTLFYARVKEK